MLLSVLLRSADIAYSGEDAKVKSICEHSENCEKGSVFFCHNGDIENVNRAVENGAKFIVASKKLTENTIVAENTKAVYSKMCAAFFENSHKKIKLIAVTGTNGKTTTANMISTILNLNGKKCAVIGTLENVGAENGTTFTTPDSFFLHKKLSELVAQNYEYCVIEASSQGLAQERLYGIKFIAAAFLNISHDHLDYHKTMEDYVSAKRKLFYSAEKAILNMDDEYFAEFYSSCIGEKITFSEKNNEADYIAKSVRSTSEAIDYAVLNGCFIHRIKLSLCGDFNVSNSLCAVAVCNSLGVSLEECAAALRSFSGVKGRMEILPIEKDFMVIIDYAHTPDSLKKVLLSLSSFKKGRIITVFGCGGNRDKAKRPLMGKYAASFSDMVIITSDNPRFEEPMSIIDDIVSGIGKSKTPVYILENRTKAIEYALKNAAKNDIILLSGKGHEDYQIIGESKTYYDEREIVNSLIKTLN